MDMNLLNLFKGQLDWHETINDNFDAVKNAFINVEENNTIIVDNLSDEFSEEKSYVTGDYCIYLNKLYKFTKNKPAGTWDGTAVVPTILSQEIKSNKALIDTINNNLGNLKIIPVQHILDTEIGTIATNFNVPERITYITTIYPADDPNKNYLFGGGSYTLIGMEYNGHKHGYQFATCGGNSPATKHRALDKGVWSEWKTFVTNSDLTNFTVTDYSDNEITIKATFEKFIASKMPTVEKHLVMIIKISSNGGGVGGVGLALTYIQQNYGMCLLIDRKVQQSYIGYYVSNKWNWHTISVS